MEKSHKKSDLIRLGIIAILIGSIGLFFINCTGGNAGHSDYVKDPSQELDHIAESYSASVTNGNQFRDFLGSTSRCCADTSGLFGCGTQTSFSTIRGLWNSMHSNNCGSLGFQCLSQAESFWRGSRCDNFNGKVEFDLEYDKTHNGVAYLYIHIYADNTGDYAGVIKFTGNLKVNPNTFQFTSGGGLFFPIYRDINGEHFTFKGYGVSFSRNITLQGQGKLFGNDDNLFVRLRSGGRGDFFLEGYLNNVN